VSKNELDFFLLGVAVGALGAVNNPEGATPEALQEAARVLLSKVDRNMRVHHMAAIERLDTLVGGLGGAE
jgi:hypothetical protein